MLYKSQQKESAANLLVKHIHVHTHKHTRWCTCPPLLNVTIWIGCQLVSVARLFCSVGNWISNLELPFTVERTWSSNQHAQANLAGENEITFDLFLSWGRTSEVILLKLWNATLSTISEAQRPRHLHSLQCVCLALLPCAVCRSTVKQPVQLHHLYPAMTPRGIQPTKQSTQKTSTALSCWTPTK